MELSPSHRRQVSTSVILPIVSIDRYLTVSVRDFIVSEKRHAGSNVLLFFYRMSRDNHPSSAKRRRILSQQEISQELLTETDDEFSDFDNDIDDPDFVLHSEHETESEQSGDEEINTTVEESSLQGEAHTTEQQVIGEDAEQYLETAADDDGSNEPNFYWGRNRFKWSSQPPSRSARTLLHNIVRMPAKTGPKTFTSYEELWSLLFSDEMISMIVTNTNQKLITYREKFKDPSRSELVPTTNIEMKAFIGLLFYTAVFKSNRENADYIFATDGTGREMFRCVMSQKRFLALNYCLRFDDALTRQQRLNDNKLAAISELFEAFVKNCQTNYTLGTHVCIDEMLVGFRGRCGFIIYMPSKPNKYGLKFLLLVDTATFYVHNIYIYHGKGSDSIGLSDEEKKFGIPTQSVVRLTKGIEGTNRNVTADNWFTSMELLNVLRLRGLTYLGTMKKNKKEIPPEFQPNRQREVGSSLYGFTKDCTIVSYVPKTNKSVILLSSMHHKKETDIETGKPAMIIDYNKTKGGVDEVDKKCSNYSTSRRTRRWPMAIFYRLVDISGINCYVLYNDCDNTEKKSRGQFLLSLGRSLVITQLKLRVYNDRLPRELRSTIQRVIGVSELPPRPTSSTGQNHTGAKRTCAICPSRLKRRTRFSCTYCDKPMCLNCCKQICEDCVRSHSY